MPNDFIYAVTLHDLKVHIGRLEPGSTEYEAAIGKVIYREHGALELHNETAPDQLLGDGVWYFALLENAKSFALLTLKSIEQQLERNFDAIQTYEGQD